MTHAQDHPELEAALVAVYRGPIEEFVSRRDALAKQLRAEKRREDADRVKALRKPSRTAWLLDTVAHEDPSVVERLATAITAAQTVSSGIELRAAMDTVRAAIRDVAAAGARVAIRAGQPVDASTLVTAVHAVMGETTAFNDLRAGRLVDVPAGGGLDILAAITITAPVSRSSAPPKPIASPKPIAPPAPEPPNVEPSAEELAREAREAREAERVRAARADLERAETSLQKASKRSDHAQKSLRETQAKLDAAEKTLLHAQAEADERRADVERARQDVDAATAQVRDAERAVTAARARLEP